MNYLFIFLLLLPVKLLLKLIQRPTGKNLVIQTAKIGDYVNITPLVCNKHVVVSYHRIKRSEPESSPKVMTFGSSYGPPLHLSRQH